MPRLDITINAPDDETLAQLIASIDAMSEHSPERCEAEAAFYTMLARVSWREADRLRAVAWDREKRQQAARKGDANG